MAVNVVPDPPARPVLVSDLGRLEYGAAWALQRRLVEARKEGVDEDRLLLVEHSPVITMGRRGREENLVLGRAALAERGVAVFEVERGGDVTYHGPGQLVAYPVLDLRGHRKDVRWFAEAMLETLVRTLADFGIPSESRHGLETGVWVVGSDGASAKIAALGVRVEHWITYHGVSLNVDPSMDHFRWIVPCGLHGAAVTSMRERLGRQISVEQVKPAFVSAFGRALGVHPRPAPPPTLAAEVLR